MPLIFFLGLMLLNLPHYSMNPTEHDELQRQVEGVLYKWFIDENLFLFCCCIADIKEG